MGAQQHVYHPATELVSFEPPPPAPVVRPRLAMFSRRRRILKLLLAFATGLTLGCLLFSGRMARPCPSTPIEIPASDEFFARPDREPEKVVALPSSPGQKSLLFVGVMTAQKYLSTRAVGVFETWGKDIPGKIAFFSSEDSAVPENRPDLPLVPLRGVDDSYPPQKKSFLMLEYMWENYGDYFEWFLRADDDVFVRADRMELFLRSVDSRKPLFVGQAGRGNQEEFGLLSLEYDENFCMGGPGIIMSRETLSRVAPHIKYCLKNLYTTHEDVELGRCVQKFAGIPCTWSYEMQTIFYHNSSGQNAFTGNLKKKEVHRAITLHPVKKHENLYRINNYMQVLKIQELQQEAVKLHRDILAMANLLNISVNEFHDQVSPNSNAYLGDTKQLGQKPGLNKYKPNKTSDIIPWDFIQRSLYSAFDSNPRKRIEAPLREGLDDVIREVMEIINMYSKQRGRVIDFKEILYGYYRYNVLYGADYILDMLLVYKKYRGRKMTVPVRRHAYLQQQFTGLEIREIFDGKEVPAALTKGVIEYETDNLPGFRESFENGLLQVGQNLQSAFLQAPELETKKTKEIKDIVINFILPLAGRFETFKRFIRNFESVCLWNGEKVTLTIVLFPSDEPFTIQETMLKIQDLQIKYENSKLSVIPIFDTFARAKALEIGASKVQAPNDLLFFIDVDMVFQVGTLQRIRTNTIRGKQVYFPIVFSEFDPRVVYNKSSSPNHFLIDENSGFWRQFGFGITSVYKSDFVKVGGFNTSIRGWGKEDVDLFDKFVTAGNISIFRSVDPGLVHVFHEVECDNNLEEVQMKMCKGTRADTYGSVQQLAKIINDHRTRKYNTNKNNVVESAPS